MVHDRTQDQVKGHRRDAVDHIHQAHQHRIYPAAEVACDAADDHPDNHFDDHHHKTDQQGDPPAVHQPCQQVHTVGVSAHQVGLGGFCISIDHPCLLKTGDQVLPVLF